MRPPPPTSCTSLRRRMTSGATLKGRETSQTMAPSRKWHDLMNGSTSLVAVRMTCALGRC